MTPHAVVTSSHGPQASTSAQALQRVESWLRCEQQKRKLQGADGRIDGVTEWGGGEFGYQYNADGDLIAIVEASGRQRRYVYDERRRLVRVEHGDGQTTLYRYDAYDRLEARQTGTSAVEAGTSYQYDTQGRVTRIERGKSDASVYRYDEWGRVEMARTSHVTTTWQYGADRRVTAIEQSLGGVSLRVELSYDGQGRLGTMTLPGSRQTLRYTWDEQGRPETVSAGDAVLLRFAFDDAARTTSIEHANGVRTQSTAHPIDGRPLSLQVMNGEERLMARCVAYDAVGQISSDGEQTYLYDGLGRLVNASSSQSQHRYSYDGMDNLLSVTTGSTDLHFSHDSAGRLLCAAHQSDVQTRFIHDRAGRLVQKIGQDETWDYRYDGDGLLLEVRRNQVTIARFLYDHKGRLAWADAGGEVERYLYGDADDLLAVTDGEGRPIRLLVRTPLGIHAEIQGALGQGNVLFRHCDERGTMRLATDAGGAVCAAYNYEPFGLPSHAGSTTCEAVLACPPPCFTGRDWYAPLGLYYFGARWYDPALGRFLTADAYTGAPDDLRLVSPLHSGSRQVALRGQILGDWLKQPRVRNAWAFCANDPIGRIDPNGHWSFGGVILMLLGAIWSLPTTLLGILIEITCLVGEVIRWLVWLFSGGHASWQTPGFDAAASGRLNAFALVFSGGWLGSFSGMLGITFGNVFFVYKEWETSPYIAALPDPIFPPAYNGRESIPRQRMLYEHELRHTQQASWFGPFYHMALPLFGFYEWDVIVKGYRNAWSERDARAHAEP